MKKKADAKKDSKAQSSETSPQAISLEARVRQYHNVQGRRELLGFADLIIGGAFVIKDISILRVKAEGQEQFGEAFVSFPSKRTAGAAESKYFDIAHPLTTEAYKRASEAIMKAYAEAKEAPVAA